MTNLLTDCRTRTFSRLEPTRHGAVRRTITVPLELADTTMPWLHDYATEPEKFEANRFRLGG
ncbi:MAG: hypothetical protein REI11_11670 [Patulibacter sp.]|nr:hypothetical protein [Patulibacter sp.]